MNTTRYGEEFERKVFYNLERMLTQDEIPSASSKRSKVYFHKKYTDNIGRVYIFDCSIETYISEEYELRGDWSSLIVIECKRYKRKVDIGDLDEFEGKLSKISPFGIKGYFVTTSGFTNRAINQARNLHYALIVCDGDNKWEWITTRNTRRDKNEIFASFLLGESPIGQIPICFKEGNYFEIVELLTLDGIILPSKSRFKAPYYTKNTINQKAQRLYSSFIGIDEDIAGQILARLYPNFKITFEPLPEGILGTTSLLNKVITLSDILLSDPNRMRFTLAHELGHIFLHGTILSEYEEIQREDKSVFFPESEQRRLDWQADTFASSLLLPSPLFEITARKIFKSCNVSMIPFIIDNQPFKNALRLTILSNLSTSFRVSKEVIDIKLQQIGFFKYLTTNPKRINNVIRGH